MQTIARRLVVLLPCLIIALTMIQASHLKAQSLGPAAYAFLMAPAPAAPPRFELVECSLAQLNSCASTLNKCKTAAGAATDERAKCGKQMGACIEGCGLIPRTCQWENVSSDVGRFTCGHPCRGGTC